MTISGVALILYGITLVGAGCFFLGRVTAGEKQHSEKGEEPSLSEAERKTLRELQNFLQYDGFSQQ